MRTEDVWNTRALANEDFKQNVFDTRLEEGFAGMGMIGSLATVFLEEKMPELVDALSF